MAPLHLVGGTRSLFFPNKGFFGFYVSGFGACRTLLDVSLIHFVVSLLSQLNRSWAWLTNAPMPQPLSVFGCEVKAILCYYLTAKIGPTAPTYIVPNFCRYLTAKNYTYTYILINGE